jgi:hypothetical protein
MTHDGIRSLLKVAEGKTFHSVFMDGSDMLARVVSATHVDEDGTVILLRMGASPEECAWQVQLAEIHSIRAPGDGCAISE